MSNDPVLPPIFSGDVVASTEVTVNTKGGSTTAILRKDLRDTLGDIGTRLSAAALQFAAGPAVVLLSPERTGRHVRVQRLGDNRFEIDLDTGDGAEIDDITAAFLTLKLAQFKGGELSLSEPMTAAQWRAEAAAWDEAAEAAQARTQPVAKAGF